MHVSRFGAASALTLALCGLAAAQVVNSGFNTATVVDTQIPDTTAQNNSYNLYGEAAVATPETASSSVANYGATAEAIVSSSAGALHAYATATQPLNGYTSYAEARSIATIDDMATIEGPQPIGTPVVETLTMNVVGTYAYPVIDTAPDLNYAGDALKYTDVTNGISSGQVKGDNSSGDTLSPLTVTFNAAIGDTIELNYSIDSWVYVAGNSTYGSTQTVDLTLAGLNGSANLPGVSLVSQTGYVYAVPAPAGLPVLALGLSCLTLKRRRK